MVQPLCFSLIAIPASILVLWGVFKARSDKMKREILPDRQLLLRPSVDEDVSMVDSDLTDSQTESPNSTTTRHDSMPGEFPQYKQKYRSVQTENYPSQCLSSPSRGLEENESFKATPQSIHSLGSSLPTEVIMELSQVCKKTRFSQTVKNVFENSWIDKSKTGEFKVLYLFDIKIVPSRLNGQTPSTGEPSSHDRQLLSWLGDFPLRFYGVSRACHIGDRDHPKNLCANDKCGICSVLKAQLKARRDDTPFELGPRIRASPQSSQADAFVRNDRVCSQQHAMILCACPGLDQSTNQSHSSNSSRPYPSSASSMKAVLPIGLIMYARKGWAPSSSTSFSFS